MPAPVTLVSLATVFRMSRNVSFGGALRDIQKTAARETRVTPAWVHPAQVFSSEI